jgi:hypothetical protein
MVAAALNANSAFPSVAQSAEGQAPSGSSGVSKPGEVQPSAPSTTPRGVNGASVPGTDIEKARDAMLGRLDGIISKALGADYKPPTSHFDRVNQAAAACKKLTGQALDDFLQAMEAAGKDFGINCGLKRGSGSERKALNFGDAAFKGVDGAKRTEVQQALHGQWASPPATASKTDATTGQPDASAQAKVSDTLFGLAPRSAAKESFTKDEVTALAKEAIQNAPEKLKASVAQLFQQLLAQFEANASEGKVSKQTLAQLIDTAANPNPAAEPTKAATPTGGNAATPDPQLASMKTQVLNGLPAPAAGDDSGYSADELKKIVGRLEQSPVAAVKAAVPALKAGLTELVSAAGDKGVTKDALADLTAKAILAQLKRKPGE